MIFEKIKRILCENFDMDDSEIVPEAGLMKDLDMDELDFWDLVMDIEDTFSVEVDDDIDWTKVTVGSIVKLIEENI
jgi:acyl carrier protein